MALFVKNPPQARPLTALAAEPRLHPRESTLTAARPPALTSPRAAPSLSARPSTSLPTALAARGSASRREAPADVAARASGLQFSPDVSPRASSDVGPAR